MKIRSMIMLSALFLLTSCGRGEVSPEHVEEATKTSVTEQEEVPEESKEDIATDKEEAIYVEYAGSMPKGFEAANGWLKAFDDTKVPLIAEYQWIKFTPFE